MSAAEACAAICAETLRHAEAAAPLVLTGGNSEGVHQLRVAMRRFNAVLKTFAPLLNRAWQVRLREQVRRLGRALGPAREWDVLLNDLLPPVEAGLGALQPDDLASTQFIEALAALRDEAARQRKLAYLKAAKVVEGDAFPILHDRVNRAVLSRDRPALIEDAAQPVAEFVTPALATRQAAVLRRGRNFAEAPEPQRHRVRLAAKSLRYGLDTIGGLYPRERLKPYLKVTKALQSDLGQLNDIITLMAQARLLKSERPDHDLAVRGMTLAAGWYAAERSRLEPALLAAWQRFIEAPPPWETA